MTLKRLLIVLSVLIVLAGGGMMWLGYVAYTPQGRARIIIAQLKGDETSLRGWMLKHHVVRPGFVVPPPGYEYDKGECKRIAAMDAMVKLGREVLPVVIEALLDENREVRLTAVQACGEFRDSAAIQPLAKCMRDATGNLPNTSSRPGSLYADLKVQWFCIRSLVEIGPEAYGPLMGASENCHPDVLQVIPVKLAQTWGSAAIPYLMELTDAHDLTVRVNAAYELGKFKDKRATDALIRQLSGEHPQPASSAARALREIGDRKAIPALLTAMKNKKLENTIRIPAAGALARLGRDEGLEYILAMVKSNDMMDRALASDELGTTQIKGTVEPLLSLLGDEHAHVRTQAVDALGRLHDPRVIPPVRKLLDDPDQGVRWAAARLMNTLGIKPTPASQPGKP